MSIPTIQGRAADHIHRRVEHLMGMPISLALRGRHASSGAGREAWQAVINQLHEVDATFSTYRDDSIINRLDRAELMIDQCPVEVAEVLELGREAERASDGAFSIMLPAADGRRRLDPSGLVKGWAVQRASVSWLPWKKPTSACPPVATSSAIQHCPIARHGGLASKTRTTQRG